MLPLRCELILDLVVDLLILLLGGELLDPKFKSNGSILARVAALLVKNCVTLFPVGDVGGATFLPRLTVFARVLRESGDEFAFH